MAVDRSQITVLLADDDAAGVRMLSRMLIEGGFGDVVSTTDSSEVIDLAERTQPGLILLDLTMPEPNGFELIKRFAEADGETPPIVLLTGHEHPAVEQQAIELGARALVGKTGSREDLLAKLDAVLAS